MELFRGVFRFKKILIRYGLYIFVAIMFFLKKRDKFSISVNRHRDCAAQNERRIRSASLSSDRAGTGLGWVPGPVQGSCGDTDRTLHLRNRTKPIRLKCCWSVIEPAPEGCKKKSFNTYTGNINYLLHRLALFEKGPCAISYHMK